MQQPCITQSKQTADYLRGLFVPETLAHKEEMFLLLLNRQNRILGWAKLSSGGISGTVLDKKVVFQIALNANASGIILCHNHPSGNLTPSQADNQLTKEVKDGGRILDIAILDHIILTPDSYYSYADEGTL